MQDMIQQAMVFQSTPCTEVQGDSPSMWIGVGGQEFQSTPCTEVQGDPYSQTSRQYHGFQSTPCTEVQGDYSYISCGFKVCCFNPLPAPKYREISIPQLV